MWSLETFLDYVRLLPGTVILTGTPFGVAEGRSPQPWLKPGDKVAVEVEGIGRLENTWLGVA